jgi:hypothetical protein
MKKFNLSRWALRHQPLILYLIIILGVIGAASLHMDVWGNLEDPLSRSNYDDSLLPIWPEPLPVMDVDQQSLSG